MKKEGTLTSATEKKHSIQSVVRKICVVGLGYVGLPLAIEFAREGFCVIGYDVSEDKIRKLRNGIDETGEIDQKDLNLTSFYPTSDLADFNHKTMSNGVDMWIVTVPTPIDNEKTPDITMLESASRCIGQNIQKGAVVVYESTVDPGRTEESCIPIIEAESGYIAKVDFKYGYSPERINPGDKEHSIRDIKKVVSGCDNESLEVIAAVYETIIDAGIHRAPSVMVAECSKIIENTQRDLGIAFMNELSVICEKLEISTKDVLEAAGTKWNFVRYFPGLVGGHCIGVDPYFLADRSRRLGHEPEVILAGRSVNEAVPARIATTIIRATGNMVDAPTREIRVLVYGITFKPDVPDVRNSKVVDLVDELIGFGIQRGNIVIKDPFAEVISCKYSDRIIEDLEPSGSYDVYVFAVPHSEVVDMGGENLMQTVNGKICIDISRTFPGLKRVAKEYWTL